MISGVRNQYACMTVEVAFFVIYIIMILLFTNSIILESTSLQHRATSGYIYIYFIFMYLYIIFYCHVDSWVFKSLIDMY